MRRGTAAAAAGTLTRIIALRCNEYDAAMYEHAAAAGHMIITSAAAAAQQQCKGIELLVKKSLPHRESSVTESETTANK